jgi:hypothetical protein
LMDYTLWHWHCCATECHCSSAFTSFITSIGTSMYQRRFAFMRTNSNLWLPVALERWLVTVVVTPRMHGIHHSDCENETNSNW